MSEGEICPNCNEGKLLNDEEKMLKCSVCGFKISTGFVTTLGKSMAKDIASLSWKDLERVEFHFGEAKFVISREHCNAELVPLGTKTQFDFTGQLKMLIEDRVKDLFDRQGLV